MKSKPRSTVVDGRCGPLKNKERFEIKIKECASLRGKLEGPGDREQECVMARFSKGKHSIIHLSSPPSFRLFIVFSSGALNTIRFENIQF